MTIDRRVPALLLALALAACGGDGAATERRTLGDGAAPAADAPEGPRLPGGAQVHLDSGNAAYRAQDYAGALAHYRQAAHMAPDQAAAWFGMTMAAAKVGDQAALDSARARVEALSPGLGASHPVDGAEPAASPHPDLPPPPASRER